MKRSVFPAVLAALIVSIFVHVVAGVLGDDGSTDLLVRAEKAEARVEEMASEMDVLVGRLERMEKRSSRVRRPVAAGPGETDAEGASDDLPEMRVDGNGRPLAPDGTPYVSQEELQAAVQKALEDRAGNVVYTPPEPAKSLEEVAQEMGLSAGEEAQIRTIMQESEDEFLDIFFPGQKLVDIKATIEDVADDPDKQADFVQGLIMKAVPNAGRLMTLESRRNRKIKNVLGEERFGTFRSKRVKPFYGDDVEDMLEDVFEGR